MKLLQKSLNCNKKLFLESLNLQNIVESKLFSQFIRCFPIFHQNKDHDNYMCDTCKIKTRLLPGGQRRTISLDCQTASRYNEGFGNRIFWEPDTKGRYKKEGPGKSSIELAREGFAELKTEIRKWREEMKEKFELDPVMVRPGDTDIVFNFKAEEDLKDWIVSSDSDHNEGNSHGSFTLSPAGHGLFSGEIDMTVPKDGIIRKAGYCNLSSYQKRKSFKRDSWYNWTCYTHLVMRVRGDGRRYLLLLNTAGTFDVSWFDLYTYVLYTRGGPYWQDVKIPFSKFCLSAKGRVQDKQNAIALTRINKLGITAADRVSAPFRLEIDYVGVHCDPSHKEKFAYEMYRIPLFIV